jgi:hypothetical protein
MSSPLFEDLKPFPDPLDRHHNQPPLEDRILQEFDETLARKGVPSRLQEVTEAAERTPAIDSPETCSKAGEIIKAATFAREVVKAQRELLNRPLLNAQRALKARADGLVAPMDKAIGEVQAAVDEFMVGQEAPVIGDLARVGKRTNWLFEIESLAKLPKDIREAQPVVEAIEKVIRSRIRAGERTIPGCRIWPAEKASIR